MGDNHNTSETDAMLSILAEHGINNSEELLNVFNIIREWEDIHVNKKIKNPFVRNDTAKCPNCRLKDVYIEDLESQVYEYCAIGNIGECRDMKKKMTPIHPLGNIIGKDNPTVTFTCRRCGACFGCADQHGFYEGSISNYCSECGQAAEVPAVNENGMPVYMKDLYEEKNANQKKAGCCKNEDETYN